MSWARRVNEWRVVPRLLVAGYGWLMWDVAQWYMGLPAPSAPQAAFVSTMTGAAAAVFGLYCNSGGSVHAGNDS